MQVPTNLRPTKEGDKSNKQIDRSTKQASNPTKQSKTLCKLKAFNQDLLSYLVYFDKGEIDESRF